ncbi:MAG TPA: prefoldin subunit alpha [Archaeoglobaceae archaeon]|nr:prefoldin subunit alpha [Archaeoglobaceae archaeon]
MAEKSEKSREVQEKLILLQQLKNEGDAVQKRILELEIAHSELANTIESLEYFDSLDGGVEALMNLGGGVFAYVDVKESKKMLVDIGAGVIVEKEVKDAIETLNRRKQKMQETISKLENMLDQIVTKAESIQRELIKLTGEGKDVQVTEG